MEIEMTFAAVMESIFVSGLLVQRRSLFWSGVQLSLVVTVDRASVSCTSFHTISQGLYNIKNHRYGRPLRTTLQQW